MNKAVKNKVKGNSLSQYFPFVLFFFFCTAHTDTQ